MCPLCRNALRKQYTTLRENLHIAVKNADSMESVLVKADHILCTQNALPLPC